MPQCGSTAPQEGTAEGIDVGLLPMPLLYGFTDSPIQKRNPLPLPLNQEWSWICFDPHSEVAVMLHQALGMNTSAHILGTLMPTQEQAQACWLEDEHIEES
jgi:hypothetical protein